MLVSPEIDAVLAGVLGLMVGSFLNVVIHRLPKMLERQWAAECAEAVEVSGKASEGVGTSTWLGAGDETDASPAIAPTAAEAPFSLMRPRSRCPHCGRLIRWHENIPVLSYLALRGRCSGCAAPIGLRYPLVELTTAALFAFAVWRWGATPAGAAWCGFLAALLALAMIDWDTTLLPDDITLPLLWAGLIAAAVRWTDVPLPDALWGAVAGYLSLWSVYKVFKLATGKEGMGYGDFKLFAALGAWFGWQALVPIILMASVIGAVVGIGLKLASGLREGGYVPFGPFLAGAGFTALVFGPASILRAIGL